MMSGCKTLQKIFHEHLAYTACDRARVYPTLTGHHTVLPVTAPWLRRRQLD